MSLLFCCSSVEPFRPQYLSHETKFTDFMAWARFPRESPAQDDTVRGSMEELDPPYAIQFVRQVNYGPLESKRYFVPAKDKNDGFIEISEGALIAANFQKLNTFKNYRCGGHDKFFEVNIYQKDPVNKHHWRADLARPASNIDL